MPQWEVKGMGGQIPRTDPRLIGDNLAEESINADLTSGQLFGLPQPVLTHDFTGVSGPVERGYLLPGGPGNPSIWVPFPSRYSSIVRSPLANDDDHRLYWTNPGDHAPHWNTYDGLKNGTPSFDLGTVQPTVACAIGTITGGTTTVPQVSRSYVYTWVNSFGEESAPSPPSNVKSGPPDATWQITGLPTSAPANPSGFNYPPITQLVLYRTITGQTTGAQYYEVGRFNYPSGVTDPYNDTVPDTTGVNNRVIESLGWGNPPDMLDGLTSLPGGMLVGWTNNTVHFCEPDRPHTWPDVYDQSMHYDIVAFAAWQQFLIVLTAGYPLTGSGNNPSNFIFVQSKVPEPCVARGSVVTDLLAVYYASANGLIQISGYGMQNQTLLMVDRVQWENRYHADNIIACRHRSQYLAINGTNQGFLIDYAETRLGFEDLNTFQDVVCIWNDEVYGDTFMCADKKIYQWDSPSALRLPYRWRSKRFFTPLPISLGAVQVTLGREIYDDQNPMQANPPLDNGDPTLDLPAGVNAIFRYFAGPDFKLIMERNLVQHQEIFRLPKGFRAFDHQIEVVATASIYSIQVATTMSELRGI